MCYNIFVKDYAKGGDAPLIKQISVFVDNTPGSLAQFTRMLGEKRIDMISLSIADTANFGILRGLVRGDPVFPFSDYVYAVKRNWKQGFLYR